MIDPVDHSTRKIPYWSFANSCGLECDEAMHPDMPQSITNPRGFVRIRRGRDPVTLLSECGIQAAMLSVIPCNSKTACHTSSSCGTPPVAAADSHFAPHTTAESTSCSTKRGGQYCMYKCETGYVYRSGDSSSDSDTGYKLMCSDSMSGLVWDNITREMCVPIGQLMPNGARCLIPDRCSSGT